MPTWEQHHVQMFHLLLSISALVYLIRSIVLLKSITASLITYLQCIIKFLSLSCWGDVICCHHNMGADWHPRSQASVIYFSQLLKLVNQFNSKMCPEGCAWHTDIGNAVSELFHEKNERSFLVALKGHIDQCNSMALVFVFEVFRWQWSSVAWRQWLCQAGRYCRQHLTG